MTAPDILIATWADGVFRVDGDDVRRELPGRSVCGLVSDARGGVLAIVDGHSLQRRSPAGTWTEVAKSDDTLSCCVAVPDAIFAGTSDANMVRFDADGTSRSLASFTEVEGRDSWYAGSALVDGKIVGPPLGVRSIAATCDDAVLLANVHVGGIARSTDAGATWRPTIAIELDVHQVRTHPSRPNLAIAASANGLCVSHDAGATWTIQRRGLHAIHCTAVAYGRDDMYVSAADDTFAACGAVYRRPIDGDESLRAVRESGLPEWTQGLVDTGCIATRDATVAFVDPAGRLYVSHDDGASWSSFVVAGATGASGLHVC